MTTFATGNPLGSTSVKDLYDNAENFDELLNAFVTNWKDRFGNDRKTWYGFEQDFAQFLLNSGFESVHLTYVDGTPLQVDRPTQLIDRAGSVYRVKLPASFPVMLTGTWATDAPLLLDVGDQSLRTALASPGGATLVWGARRDVNTVAALRLMAGRYNGDQATIAGYYSSASRTGGGRVVWDATSTDADNGFTVFQATGVATGRWKRVIKGPLYAAQSGAVADYSGSTGTDNRVILQAAIDIAAPITGHLILDGHYGISFDNTDVGRGLSLPSNFELRGNNSAQLSALAHNATIYQMIRVWGKDNVSVSNIKLDGRKDLNAAVTGEFGMGVDVRGGSNIKLRDIQTLNMWGDGYYQGLTTGTNLTASNVVFDNHFADGCRRQGASIISAIQLDYNNPIWQNIAGTAPASGIDFEPNSNFAEYIGVRINNPKTVACTTGVKVDFALLTTGGTATKYIDIVVTGHRDYGSTTAANVSRVNTGAGTNKVLGNVTFVDPTWERSGNFTFFSEDWDYLGPLIRVVRPTVIDPNRNGQTSPVFGSPFVVTRAAGSANTYAIGNVDIEEASIRLTSGTIPFIFAFDNLSGDNTTIKQVHFRDPLEITGTLETRGYFFGTGSISDKYNLWSYASAGSATMTPNYTAPITFPTASSNFTLDGTSHVAGSPDLIYRTTGPNTYNVIGPAAGAFVGAAGATTQLRSTAGAGSYVRLRPLGAGKFLIVEKAGAWAEF